LQPASPEERLGPGASLAFPEKWALRDLAKSVNTPAQARALAKRLPPSPFE
jgi:hypothetical protein